MTMANSLINLSDIYTVTGLSESNIEALIPYAEAQAEVMIGFLQRNDSKTKSFYIWDATDILKLDDYPINEVSEITYQVSGSGSVETFDEDEYRVIESDGMIIMDSLIPEGHKVTVTFDIGWDQDTVTSIVKLLLIVLTLNHYYSLNPDMVQHSQVLVSEKIGDYTKKYANLSNTEFKSLDEWATYLATIIRKGGTEPGINGM
jgi:hypothetical protein